MMTKFINIDGVRIHTDLINTYQASYDSDTQESTITIELEDPGIFETNIITMGGFIDCGVRDEFLSYMDEALGTKVIRAWS